MTNDAERLRILEEDIDVLEQARGRLERLRDEAIPGDGRWERRAHGATLIARVLDDLAAERRRLMEDKR